MAPIPVIVREAGGWARLDGGEGRSDLVLVGNGRPADDLTHIIA